MPDIASGTTNVSFLHALRLGSPSLPVGTFSYSQGLEYAIEDGWICNSEDLYEWMKGILESTHSYIDLPLLRRSHAAWKNEDYIKAQQWNSLALAQRETRELLDEDSNLGIAMHRLLLGLGLNLDDEKLRPPHSFVTLFSLAGAHWQVPLEQLCLAYSWSWAENQVAAAIKSFPLGQTSGQLILCNLMPTITQAVECSATVSDNNMGASCYGLSIASMLHETQYSRLFRS